MAIFDITPSSVKYINHLAFSVEKGYTISGQVIQQNIPLPCKIRLYDQSSAQFLYEISTDEQGYYTFDNLNPNYKFFIVAHHPNSEYNAVIQDNIIPK